MKKKKNEFYDTYRKLQRSWNGVNPITKIIPNKKRRNRKSKHKGEEIDA